MNPRYLEGGVDSGFKPIDDDEPIKRLFQVKGRKNIRVEQASGTINVATVYNIFRIFSRLGYIAPSSGDQSILCRSIKHCRVHTATVLSV